jgi:hypothetical protein
LVLSGVFYLLALIAFGVIAMWFMQNDRRAPGERTIGLLRMKDTIPGELNTKEATERSADLSH